MNPPKRNQYRAFVPIAIALAVAGTSSVSADSLSARAQPISNVISKLRSQYGINVVIKGDIPAAKSVVPDVDDLNSGATLVAMIDLANSVNADFNKTFVISKLPSGQAVPNVKLDSDPTIVFPRKRMVTADAIEYVTGVDNASAKVYGTINSHVILSNTTLSASQAANEIAKQTHTQWKPFYALTPRGRGSRNANGRVIGYTNGGLPIVQQPYVYQHTTSKKGGVPEDWDVRDQPARDDMPPIIAATPPATATTIPPPGVRSADGQTVIGPGFAVTGAANPAGNNPYASNNPYGAFNPYMPYGNGANPYGGYTPYPNGYGPNNGGYMVAPPGSGPIVNGVPMTPVPGGAFVNGQPVGGYAPPPNNGYGNGYGYGY